MTTSLQPDSEGRVAVLGAGRSPFGRFGGSLRHSSLPELAAAVVPTVLGRAEVGTEQVDQLVFGVNFPGGDRSIARQLQLRAGVPETAFPTRSTGPAARRWPPWPPPASIRLGDVQVAVAGGVENLSQVPYFIKEVRFGKKLGDVVLTDQLVVSCPHTGVARAVQASTRGPRTGSGAKSRTNGPAAARRATPRPWPRLARENRPRDPTRRTGRAVTLDPTSAPAGAPPGGPAGWPPLTGARRSPRATPPTSSSGAALVLAWRTGDAAGARRWPAAGLGRCRRGAAAHRLHARRGGASSPSSGPGSRSTTSTSLRSTRPSPPCRWCRPWSWPTATGAGRPAPGADQRQRRLGGHRSPDRRHRRPHGHDGRLRAHRRGGGTGLVTICGGIGEAEALRVRGRPGHGGRRLT